MKHISSLTVAELLELISIEEQKYKEVVQTDLPFEEAKCIYIKVKELKNVLDKKQLLCYHVEQFDNTVDCLKSKAEWLNAIFSEQIIRREAILKKMYDGI